MRTTPTFAMVSVPRAPRSKIIDVRKLFFLVAMLAAATTPSYAATITYNFAARIDVAVALDARFYPRVRQARAVLHGTMTVNTSLPDHNASPDIGQYVATSAPSAPKSDYRSIRILSTGDVFHFEFQRKNC